MLRVFTAQVAQGRDLSPALETQSRLLAARWCTAQETNYGTTQLRCLPAHSTGSHVGMLKELLAVGIVQISNPSDVWEHDTRLQ